MVRNQTIYKFVYQLFSYLLPFSEQKDTKEVHVWERKFPLYFSPLSHVAAKQMDLYDILKR